MKRLALLSYSLLIVGCSEQVKSNVSQDIKATASQEEKVKNEIKVQHASVTIKFSGDLFSKEAKQTPIVLQLHRLDEEGLKYKTQQEVIVPAGATEYKLTLPEINEFARFEVYATIDVNGDKIINSGDYFTDTPTKLIFSKEDGNYNKGWVLIDKYGILSSGEEHEISLEWQQKIK